VRLELRRLAPGEVDHELIWGSIFFALAAAALLLSRVPGVGLPCWFHAVSGWPCPACGLTRAGVALANADPRAAFLVNPLGAIVMLVVGAWSVAALALVALRLPRPRVELTRRWEANALRAVVVAVVLVNWSYLIAHGT